MKTMKKVFMMAMSVMLAASMAACGDSSSDTTSDSGQSGSGMIKIGLHYELTGAVADYGTAERKGSHNGRNHTFFRSYPSESP